MTAPNLRLTKLEAQYTEYRASPEKCADCRMYEAAGRCTLVEGSISPAGWCRMWRKDERRAR